MILTIITTGYCGETRRISVQIDSLETVLSCIPGSSMIFEDIRSNKKLFSLKIFLKYDKKYIKGDGLDQNFIKIALKLPKYWKIVDFLDVKI